MSGTNAGCLFMIRDTSAQDRKIAVAPMSSGKKAAWLAIAVGAVVLLLWAGPAVTRWFGASRSVDGERLRTAQVTRGTLVRDVLVPGRIVAAVSPTLFAPAAGTVSFTVKAGDSVAQDQVLATVDSPELNTQLKQEQATLDSLSVDVRRQRIEGRKQKLEAQKEVALAQVTLDAATREMQRADHAWDKGAISQVDHLRAKDNLKNAQIAFEHAQQDAALKGDGLDFEQQARELTLKRQELRVTELQRLVDGLSIRAPVAGMVGSVAVADKTAVATNQGLLTVVDLTRLEVDVQIPETYADDLGLGMGAEVRIGGGTAAGELSAISPEIIQNQVTGRVRFAQTQPEGLRQNQRVNVRIVIDQRADTLMVARGPFMDTGGGRVAYVLREGTAEKRAIEIGATSVSDVEIVKGLALGETVVISGIEDFAGAERVIVN
jgi:HlyD family secretion protein